MSSATHQLLLLAVNSGYVAAPTQTFAGALASKSATETGIDFTTPAAATFNSEAYDTDTIHDTSSNTSRLTIPSALNGKYGVIRADVILVNVSSYSHYISIYKNGSPSYSGWGGSMALGHNSEDRTNCWTAPLLLTTGDYYEVFVYSSDNSTDVHSPSSVISLEVIG